MNNIYRGFNELTFGFQCDLEEAHQLNGKRGGKKLSRVESMALQCNNFQLIDLVVKGAESKSVLVNGN